MKKEKIPDTTIETALAITLDLFTTMIVVLQVVYARKGRRMYKNKSMERNVWGREKEREGGRERGKEKKREIGFFLSKIRKSRRSLCTGVSHSRVF